MQVRSELIKEALPIPCLFSIPPGSSHHKDDIVRKEKRQWTEGNSSSGPHPCRRLLILKRSHAGESNFFFPWELEGYTVLVFVSEIKSFL